jgi:hypothetical protein
MARQNRAPLLPKRACCAAKLEYDFGTSTPSVNSQSVLLMIMICQLGNVLQNSINALALLCYEFPNFD